MPNDESKFPIPIEESRRSRFGTQEQKALGRRLAGQISSRAIDRPTIGKRRNRSFGSGATGGIAGSLDPRNMSMVDFDRDGWAREGSTNPVWVGVKPGDMLRPRSLSSGDEKKKPKKPKYPRKPTYGPLLGRANEVFKGVSTWEEFKERYQDTEITYIDYETTGLVFDKWGKSSGNGAPVQIGAIKVKNGKVTARFETYINPNMPLDKWEKWSRDTLVDYEQNPLSDEFLSDKPSIAEAHKKLIEFIGPNAILGVQNAAFDKDVLEDNLSASGIDWRPDGWIDLKDVAEMTLPRWSKENQDGPKRFDQDTNEWVPSNSLKDITKYLGVELEGHHTADVDAEATANSMNELIDRAIKNNWNVDLLDPIKRDSLMAKSEKKYKEDMDAFPEKVEKYLQMLEDIDAAEKRSLSSGDKTNQKLSKTRPIIKMNPGEKSKLKQHRKTDYNYGDKSELGGEIRRSKNDWMKGMTSQQMAKLLVPESKQQHFDMWLDDWAPQAKDDKKIVDAFRKYWDEMEAANPWDVLDYSPENVGLTRKLISEALDDNPIMKWAFETHGSPMIGILSKEAVETYENTPTLKAKLEEIQRSRNLKNRPTFGAKTTPRFDLISFNSSRIRGRVSNEETIVPWLFGAGKPTESIHHVDNSVAGTLLHEWGHWIHFRAVRDYEIGMSGKPSNRIAYYGTGNSEDNSYIQALSVAAEYNQTSMDSEMIERHRAGGDINETKDKPRLLTSYGNVNMAEAMAEGITAYLHPNQEMKYLVMNEKLRRDVESILNIEDGETPWESIAQSTERSLSSGITEKQRSVFDERIDKAKKEIEQRAYDKFVKKFDDGLDEDFEKFGTPVDGKLVLPEKDAKKLFTESIQRLIKSKRVQKLFEGLAPYDWRGREEMFQAGLVKGDIASRIAESIQFTPEEFISTFKRSSLNSADPNHKSYKKFLSFEDSKNFKMIEAILSGDNKLFGLNLRTGDIEPQGVSEEIIKARQATHELIELNLRELTLAQIRQAFLRSNFQGPAESDPFLVLWKNFENTSNDSNQLLKYAADPKPVGPNPPPWNPDGLPLPPKDPLELDVRGTTVTRTINIVDDTWSRFSHFNGTWIDEISKNPNTTMRMYSLKNIETGQMHGDMFFADDNPNINWFEQEDLQKNIELNYGEFNQDDWEAVAITKDNWDSKTVEDVFTAQMIKLLSDEYGMGMNARFKGTQIFDTDSPEGAKILKQTIIADLIRTWAISSNDENIVALTMQNIIRKEFGLSDAIGWDRNTGLARDPKQTEILPSNVAFDSGIDLSPDAEAMLRNVVRAQYEATQEYFKIRNIEHVALYRGVAGLNDKEVKEKIAKFKERGLFAPIIRDEVVMRPASSWSFDPSTAEDFSTRVPLESLDLTIAVRKTNTEDPAIIKSIVPVKNILSIPFTGFGCLHEEEAVVLGRPIDAYVGVYLNRHKGPTPDKFLLDKLKAEDGILEKIVAITPEEFFSNKDANEVSDMGLDIASEIKNALSSGSTTKPTHKIKYGIAELMKRSRSLDLEYEIDEDRAKLYNETLRKGFRGGFTVQVDHHSDVKSGIAIARNKHGLNFDAKTDFDSDGNPSADLVRRFHAWMMFHGPLTFKNPRDGAKEVTIGGWLAKGKIYLDVVDVYPNTPENKIMASRLGRKEKQIAITDLDELYRLLDAGEENLDSAFISTGGDGGQTLSVRTIDKFASLMTQLDSNMARTGSNHLKEIGRLQKFKEKRRALASRRVRFIDPANPSKEVDYMLVALPGDGENEMALRAYDYSTIDAARDAVAQSRGANRRDISLGDSLDYILDPSRQNLRINRPVAEMIVGPKTSDNTQFEVQPRNIQEKYSRRGIDAALQRLHEDINPTSEMAFSSGFTTNESGSGKLKISENVDERILDNQYSPIRTVKFSSDGTEKEYLIFATGENGEFVWVFDRSMMSDPMNNIQRTASIQMHRVLGQQTIPENVMNRNILRTGSREAVALREFNRIGKRPKDNEWAKLVGLMRVEGTYQQEDKPGPSKIVGITVEANHKRRGLASAALKFHRDFWPEQNLQHSRELSGDGAAFARATPINSLSSGDESRINLSDEEKREIIAIASQRTDSFSQSVVDQFRRNGKLSDRQWRALNRMTLRRNSLSSGQNPVVPANKRYNNIKGDGKGNCFDSAANLLTQLVADNPERSGDFKLVHGAPLGTGGEAKDIRFHHAWVEETVRKTDDEIETIINNYPKNMREQVRRQLGSLLSEQVLVHDNSNGREVFMPREVYYSIGNIDGDLVQKYSLEEMSKKQRENKHYGPYDLDEETESMSSDQSALLDEMENIREELENYLGTDDLESLENWVMSTEWPKDYLDVVSGKDYEFDEHYVVLQERLKSAGIPDVVVVRRQGTPLEKGNIRNGSMVSGWKGGSGKYHYGKDRKIFESLVPRENIVGIGHVEEGEIFYKLDGVETTELSLSSGRINKPSKKTTRKSFQKSNLPDTAVFAQTSRAQKKTKQINFEITPIDKNDDRVSWLDTKPTIDVSDPALPSVLREYSELIKWLDGKPSSWSSNGYSNTELLLRPNDRWDLNEFLIQSRAWISPAKFVEIKDKKGRKKIYAIVHSGPEEINVYDVEQLEKDLKGKYDFRNWDDIKEIYTYDSKFKKRKSVIAAKLTARRGPERDSPWEISRVLVTPKHEGIGIGKTMIDFHREEFAELEATFKYRDPRSQAYGNYRSQYAPIRQQIPGPWNNSIFMNPEDPDLPNEETASLSSGARRTTESMKPRRDGQLSLSSGDDYRGQHEAPGRGSGAPLHDLISPDYSVYPEDVYSSNAIRYYGVGDEKLDPMTAALINRFKGKPNAEITIYRAAPVSRDKQIERLEKQIRRYMQYGKFPPNVPSSVRPRTSESNDWYVSVTDEIERLKKLPPDDFKIRSGDWVTPFREYAVNHGEGSLRGEYEIVKKRVKAKHIYTAGDSWLEWGYDDSEGSLSMSSGGDKNLNIYSEKIDAEIVSSAIAKNKKIDKLRKERIKDIKDSGYGDITKDTIEEQDRIIKRYMDYVFEDGQDGNFRARWKKKPYPVLTDMEEAMNPGSPYLIPLSEIEEEAEKLGIIIRNPRHRIHIRKRPFRASEPYDPDADDRERLRVFEKYQSMQNRDTIDDWSDLEILVMDLSFEILYDDIELNETNNSESERQEIRESKPDSRPAPEYVLRSFDSLSVDEQEELITEKIKKSIAFGQYWDLTIKFRDRAEFENKYFSEDNSNGLRINYNHDTLKRKPRKKTRADYRREYERDKKKRENDGPSLSSGGREDANWNDEIKSLTSEIEELAKTLDDISEAQGLDTREVTRKGKLIDIDNPTQEQTLLIPSEEIMKVETALNGLGKKALDMASARVVRSGFCEQKDLDEAIAHQSRPKPEPKKSLTDRAINKDPKVYPLVKKEVDDYLQNKENYRLTKNELTKATKAHDKHMRFEYFDRRTNVRTDEQKRELADKTTDLQQKQKQAKENNETAKSLYNWSYNNVSDIVNNQILWGAEVERIEQTDEQIKKQGYDVEKQSWYLQIHQAVGQEVRKLLAEHRNMSTEYPAPVQTIEPTYYPDKDEQKWRMLQPGESRVGASRQKQELIVKLAASEFPRGLLQKIKSVSIKLTHISGGQYQDRHKLITADTEDSSSLTHEIVHALTYHSRIMRLIEQAALTRRTWGKSGDTTTPIEEKIKQGRQKQVNEVKAMGAKYKSKYKALVSGSYILDAFADPYQGRIYGSENTATEILSVATENLFGRGGTMRQGRADRDLMATALGALLTAEKKSDNTPSLSSGSEFSNQLSKIKSARLDAESTSRITESFKIESLDTGLIDKIETEAKERRKVLLAENEKLENVWANRDPTDKESERLEIIDRHLLAARLAESAIAKIRQRVESLKDPGYVGGSYREDLKLITSRDSNGKLLGLALVGTSNTDSAVDRAGLYEGLDKPQEGRVLFLDYIVNLGEVPNMGRNLFGKILEESVDDNVSLIQLESSDSGRAYWEKMGFVQKESINGNPQMGDITPYYFLAVSPDEIGKELK